MKNRVFVGIFALLLSNGLSGQESYLYKDIENVKKTNVTFEKVSIFNEQSKEKDILGDFINPDEVYFFNYNASALKSLGKALRLTIPYKGNGIELELMEVSDSFYDFEIETADGTRYPANRENKHYRGVVKNNPNSIVAISMFENEVMGLVATDEGNFNIALDQKSGNHIFYNDQNLKEKPVFECATESGSIEPFDSDIQQGETRLPTIKKCVRFYFETEYDIFTDKGYNKNNVENYVTGVYNQVAILYENEGIYTAIASPIKVWDDTITVKYPYSGKDNDSAIGLLGLFQKARTSINGDLGMLLTFRSLWLEGKAAKIGALCSALTEDRLAVAQIGNTYANVPTYSFSVRIIAHEFGHSLGSDHTNACVWNNNGTAIDGCFAPTGCSNPGPPSNGGTIMSFCTGYSLYNGFGPQPGDKIRNHVINSSCLLCAAHFTDFCLQVSTSSGQYVGSSCITSVLGLCPNETYHISVQNNSCCSSISNYQWTVPSGWTVNYTSGNMISINTNSTLNANVIVKANACCGNNQLLLSAYFTADSNCSRNSSYFIIKPNPVSDVLNIQIDMKAYEDALAFSQVTNNDTNIQVEMSFDIRLYSAVGLIVATATSKGEDTNLNVTHLPNGFYILHIYDNLNETPYVQRIVVQH